jgi:hypothetical protein
MTKGQKNTENKAKMQTLSFHTSVVFAEGQYKQRWSIQIFAKIQ